MIKHPTVGRPRRKTDSQGRLQCCICRYWQTPENYYLNSQNSSGRDSRCKSCDSLRRKDARQKRKRVAIITEAKSKFIHWKRPSTEE